MENWRPIEGYEGHYKVSDGGRIKGLMSRWGPRETILKPAINRGGYEQVILSVNRVPKTVRVHRVVAITFVENPLNKKYVNHIDGNKLNNNLINLEWVTSSENNKHAYATGLKDRTKCGFVGSTHPMSILTEDDVLEIRSLSKHLSQSKIAEMYCMSPAQISSIISRRNWKHI